MTDLQKPYIKKLDEIENFTVYYVDGKYIRDNMNREFTNFGQHYRFNFIPKYEFWIDNPSTPGEEEYFIDHLLVEWHHMDKGETYDEAIVKGDAREKKERNKSSLMKKVLSEVHKHPKQVPSHTYRKKLEKFGDAITVWIVDGQVVRDLYFIDFTEGGHHYVYPFVPLTEVWIDDDLTPTERDYVILHELHERYLMSQGMSYSRAHASSSAIEYICRRNPEKLEDYINKEVEKNKTI